MLILTLVLQANLFFGHNHRCPLFQDFGDLIDLLLITNCDSNYDNNQYRDMQFFVF